MTTVKYANPGSPGAFANVIGWIDFSDVQDSIIQYNQTVKVTNTLPNGYTLTFDITNNGTPDVDILAVTPGTFPYGTTGYVGVGGKPILSSDLTGINIGDIITSSFKMSNITLKDSNGVIISNFSIIAADANETISDPAIATETLIFNNPSGSFTQIDMLQPTSGNPIVGPTFTIAGQNVTVTGSAVAANTGAPVFSTLSPNTINTTFSATFNVTTGETTQAAAFGIMLCENASCCLDVDVSPDNTVIYVCPGRKQFFSIRPKKCCGIVSLYYLGDNFNSTENYVEGTLGNYTLLPSGILLDAPCNLKDGDTDILSFQVSDSSCNPPFILNVVFTYSLCECC